MAEIEARPIAGHRRAVPRGDPALRAPTAPCKHRDHAGAAREFLACGRLDLYNAVTVFSEAVFLALMLTRPRPGQEVLAALDSTEQGSQAAIGRLASRVGDAGLDALDGRLDARARWGPWRRMRDRRPWGGAEAGTHRPGHGERPGGDGDRPSARPSTRAAACSSGWAPASGWPSSTMPSLPVGAPRRRPTPAADFGPAGRDGSASGQTRDAQLLLGDRDLWQDVGLSASRPIQTSLVAVLIDVSSSLQRSCRLHVSLCPRMGVGPRRRRSMSTARSRRLGQGEQAGESDGRLRAWLRSGSSGSMTRADVLADDRERLDAGWGVGQA